MVNEELNKMQLQIDELNGKIEIASKELDKAIKNEDEKRDLFQKRLVVMYEKGNMAYVEAMISSSNIMDLSKRSELIRQISENDKKILDDYVQAKNDVLSKKEELEKNTEQCQKKVDEFNETIHTKSTEIEELDGVIQQKSTELTALNNEKTEIDNQIYSQSYAGRIFAEGEKYLGYPYVWGGSTPETSFDCSGFVCWTYTHSGVYNLPRTTAQQIYNQCKKISPEEAKKGDLVFFQGTYQSYEPVTHIGIYAGDGNMLHCGNPIKYASIHCAYWESHFYAFGRLVS
ncbi:MAG: C40 family peptidase [Clostridia bacterium]|nr:C40 family peptidase [Clostridia bacterium]